MLKHQICFALLIVGPFGCRDNEAINQTHMQEDVTMTQMIKKIGEEELEKVAGGNVNDNMTPESDKIGGAIDDMINGKNYDAIAQIIADYLNGDNVRTRNVDNNVDIYDCEI